MGRAWDAVEHSGDLGPESRVRRIRDFDPRVFQAVDAGDGTVNLITASNLVIYTGFRYANGTLFGGKYHDRNGMTHLLIGEAALAFQTVNATPL
jgi:hypothetical protein